MFISSDVLSPQLLLIFYMNFIAEKKNIENEIRKTI